VVTKAQTITCSSLCVTLIANDTVNNGIAVSVSIVDSGFINYPFVYQILDQSINVIGTGSMFYFGQFGTTTQIYPATSTNTNWTNFIGTVVFVYDNDTCYLPYPCTTSSTQDFEQQASLTLSPNPATDQVVVTTQAELNCGTLEIVTLDGKTVQVLNGIRGNRIEIATDQLANGMYFLRISEEDHFLKSERVIIFR